MISSSSNLTQHTRLKISYVRDLVISPYNSFYSFSLSKTTIPQKYMLIPSGHLQQLYQELTYICEGAYLPASL